MIFIIRCYARVSSKGQEKYGNGLESQIAEMKAAGGEKFYSDAYTGTECSRPEFDRLLEELEPNDTLMVTKLDRIARSFSQGSKLVSDLIDRGVKVHILNIGLMDNTSSSKLIRNIFFAFAEFERDMILERCASGKAIAKTKPDFKEGRPKVYSEEQINLAMSLLRTHSYRQVEKMTGISKSTILRAQRTQKL